MEHKTITEPFADLFRMHITRSGTPIWCMFDYAVSPVPEESAVKITLVPECDAETIKWFPHLQNGMLHGIVNYREHGCNLFGIHIEVQKIYTHSISTTEQACITYGAFFISYLERRAVPVE